MNDRLAATAVPFVDLAAQTATIHDEVQHAVMGVIARGDFILGEEVERFEQAFAEFVGVSHTVGVASGLDALRLSLLVLGVGPGDEVILPANTYIATALAVSAVGATAVLVDCDRDTYNIDPAQIEAAITSDTKAIIPVHLTGHAADMEPILELAGQRGIHVVEDACQAHGAAYGDKPCGSMGATGCFSFYPGKNLGAFGDGGLITTNDDDLAERLRRMRNYGQRVKYEHVEQGVNSRLDTVQAAVLNVKLRRLDDWNSARQSHAQEYRRELAGVGDLRFQSQQPRSTHVYHLFMVETDSRDDLQGYLSDQGIQTGIHYPVPIHLQPAYNSLGLGKGSFPVVESLADRILSLPMFPELTGDQISCVADAIRCFFR